MHLLPLLWEILSLLLVWAVLVWERCLRGVLNVLVLFLNLNLNFLGWFISSNWWCWSFSRILRWSSRRAPHSWFGLAVIGGDWLSCYVFEFGPYLISWWVYRSLNFLFSCFQWFPRVITQNPSFDRPILRSWTLQNNTWNFRVVYLWTNKLLILNYNYFLPWLWESILRHIISQHISRFVISSLNLLFWVFKEREPRLKMQSHLLLVRNLHASEKGFLLISVLNAKIIFTDCHFRGIDRALQNW